MTREEAIQVLKNTAWLGANEDREATEEAIDMAIEALSVDAVEVKAEQLPPKVPPEWINEGMVLVPQHDWIEMQKKLEEYVSAEAVQWWRTGKPKKQGEYIVTVKSMRGGMVESLYYGKPLMPTHKVKGMCWYRSDDEWGDVVYDDADILAWMPLPKPYRGGDDE